MSSPFSPQTSVSDWSSSLLAHGGSSLPFPRHVGYDRVPALLILAVFAAGVLLVYWRFVLWLLVAAMAGLGLFGAFAVIDAFSAH